MTDRPFPAKAGGEIPEGASPADFALGSVESRVAARALFEARKPLETSVELDDDFNPVFDPSKRYARFVVFMPRSMSREEWIQENTLPTDPVERGQGVRAYEEKLRRQRENWLKWHRLSRESLGD